MQANANAERAHVMRFIFRILPRGDAPLFIKSKKCCSRSGRVFLQTSGRGVIYGESSN
jgi:hypothetical protein